MKDREYEVLLDSLHEFGFSLSDPGMDDFVETPESFARYCLTMKKYQRMGRDRAKAEILKDYRKELEKDRHRCAKAMNGACIEAEGGMAEILRQWDEIVEQQEADARQEQEIQEELSIKCPTCGRPR